MLTGGHEIAKLRMERRGEARQLGEGVATDEVDEAMLARRAEPIQIGGKAPPRSGFLRRAPNLGVITELANGLR